MGRGGVWVNFGKKNKKSKKRIGKFVGPKRLMFLKNSLWDDDAATHFQLGWEGMSWRFWNTSAFIEVSSLHKGATKKRGVISESVTPQWNRRNRYHTHLYSCNLIPSSAQVKSTRKYCRISPKTTGWNYKPSIVGFRSHLSVDSHPKKKRLTIVLPQTPHGNISPAATARDDHQGLFFSSTWSNQSSYQPRGPKVGGLTTWQSGWSGFRLVAGTKKLIKLIFSTPWRLLWVEVLLPLKFHQPFPRVLKNLTFLQLQSKVSTTKTPRMWNDDTTGSTVHQPMAHEEGNLTLGNPESDSPKQQASCWNHPPRN